MFMGMNKLQWGLLALILTVSAIIMATYYTVYDGDGESGGSEQPQAALTAELPQSEEAEAAPPQPQQED